jgi:hypothetical protein
MDRNAWRRHEQIARSARANPMKVARSVTFGWLQNGLLAITEDSSPETIIFPIDRFQPSSTCRST